MDEAKKLHNKPERGGTPGVYSHPLVGEKLHATSFPQADALLRQGWVWESELPKYEVITESPSVSVNAAAEVEDLRARLAAAETSLKAAQEQAKANQASEADENKKAAQETLEREQARKEQEEARTKSEEKVAEANRTLNNSNEQKGNK